MKKKTSGRTTRKGSGDAGGDATVKIHHVMKGFFKIAHLTGLLQLPGRVTDLACGIYKRVIESHLLDSMNKNALAAACLVSASNRPTALLKALFAKIARAWPVTTAVSVRRALKRIHDLQLHLTPVLTSATVALSHSSPTPSPPALSTSLSPSSPSSPTPSTSPQLLASSPTFDAARVSSPISTVTVATTLDLDVAILSSSSSFSSSSRSFTFARNYNTRGRKNVKIGGERVAVAVPKQRVVIAPENELKRTG
jgi:hypothetical protein